MATQTDVQQLIQSLVPSGVNNGNPNTIYNVPPPSLDAQGNWAQGRLPPAASIGGLNLPAILAQLPAPNWGGGPVAGAPAGPLLPSFPAPGGGGGGGGTGGGGGFVPPDMSTPTPPLPEPGDGYQTGGGGSYEPIRHPYTGIPQQTAATPGTWTNSMGGFGTVGPWAGGMTGRLGGGGGGGFNIGGWQGAIDKIANLFGVDPYMQGTGQWNFQGAASDILSQIVGLPLEGIARQLGAGGYDNWLGNFIYNQNMRNFEDKKAQTMEKMFKETLQGLQDGTLAKYGIDPNEGQAGAPKMTGGGRDTRSAAGAGSTTIAEGPAAQQMFEGMRQSAMEQLMKSLAEGAMNRQYNVER